MAGTGIHVSLIEPGPIDTRFRANARAQFERWIDWKASARRADYERLMDRLYGAAKDRWQLPPAAVTRALVHAVEAPRPRARYRVTTPTKLAAVARRMLSTRGMDRILSNS